MGIKFEYCGTKRYESGLVDIMLNIVDIDEDYVQDELRIWIEDTYRTDETFSPERVEETLQSIIDGNCEIVLDENIVHIDIEYGLGALDATIGAVVI